MKKSIKDVKKRMDAAWARSPRSSKAKPLLMAVSKTQPAGQIADALSTGVDCIGENRIQELRDKKEELGKDWPVKNVELIGPVQTNKVKFLSGLVSRIQTLDRVKLGDALEKVFAEQNKIMPVLVQVNIDREKQKAGVAPEELASLLATFPRWPHLKCQGLMAIPKVRINARQVRPSFQKMSQIFEELKGARLPDNVVMKELCMGMSGDFEVAIEEGATMIRIGTAIFGPRD